VTGPSDEQIGLVIRTVADGSLKAATRDAAARRLVNWLRRWAPQYVARVWMTRSTATLAEDAIQHVAVAALEHRAPAFASDGHAVAWCKQVLRNFVVSELRMARRVAAFRDEEGQCGGSGYEASDLRMLVSELIECARDNVARAGRTNTARCRLELLDWLVADVHGATRAGIEDDRKHRNRVEQRRCRAIRLVRRTIQEM
jgi:hypothetical protein